ncbi:MAG TPA: nuclear transport factor 2 family protein [Solirubrobacterales bacterium]|nr:nuclear transport factor 2 family protein [Solirubrobacterales bacterium]
MTGENESIVRRIADAASQSSTVDEFMADVGALLHPEVEYINPPDAIETGTRKGLTGMKLVFTSIIEGAGSDGSIEITQLIGRGEYVFHRGLITVRGSASGIEVPGRSFGLVTTFRDGLVFRMEWFWDEGEAFALFEERTREN